MGRRVFYPAGSLADGGDPVLVTPELAGWTYCGLRVIHLDAGAERTVATGSAEMIVLPLSGGCVVECGGERFELTGREDVFSRVSDFAYAPIDALVTLSSDRGGAFALCLAEATQRLEPRYGPAEDVPIEVRGAGQATRQITNFATPDAFAAHKLIAVEVLTPEGNWSSYPPHKHDEQREGEAQNEEIYYFRVDGEGGMGLHHLYTYDEEFHETARIGDGDVFLIPRGYHGPSVAAPGYHLYYLNIMAGPQQERSMLNCLDPAHEWVARRWEEQDVPQDPRLPLTTAEGRHEPDVVT